MFCLLFTYPTWAGRRGSTDRQTYAEGRGDGKGGEGGEREAWREGRGSETGSRLLLAWGKNSKTKKGKEASKVNDVAAAGGSK